MFSTSELITRLWSDETGPSPLFFPDIGTFFNQDMGVARDLVSQIAKAGAPIIKGEILHDPSIALKCDTLENYLANDGSVIEEKISDVIERKIIPLERYEALFDFCKSLNLEFVVSVYDKKGADFAYDIGASALKIASSNIVHQPLITYVAQHELPMIIDTGKSTFEEIVRAVQWAKDAGGKMILIQHSPPAPPAPINQQNLGFLNVLERSFGCPVGLSDHHYGEEMLFAAIALGASCVEKGIIPDNLECEQDGFHALKIGEFEAVFKKCMNIAEALSGQNMRLSNSVDRHPYRMGLVASSDIEIGDILNENNVRFAFPAKGIPVENWESVIGLKASRNISMEKEISWQDIDFEAQ